ncbi:gamma-glutamyltransferase family protein [Desulfoluna butyratoxydans]|uniref:Gamma-glutamyltranspeptidase n=1 Tax=Desulfoluna butyratoxydans TaxID=231438 RepID=A0A4U8YRQ5_9BACT|nr:gamma-glutamyltransferase [Desulfoluna butyratoxydans]VFQ46571.1 gamma-glutamyltranspeptidase [Desulfoluna butyratoxydans]
MIQQHTRRFLDTDLVDPSDKRIHYPQRVGVSAKGMVASQHHLATEAGRTMLAAGGNAVDAAVAVAFALGVVEPAASGLGGQTMLTLHLTETERTFCLDGGSRAPNRTPPGELERAEQLRGHRATTVPSTPAVLFHALKHYGTKSLDEVLAPSIELAEKGYRISPLQHHLTRRELKHLKSHSGAPFFLKGGKTPYPIGAIFQQPVLAGTLKHLAKEGIEDFYQGEIAQLIHDDMESNNGLLRDDDLAQIPWPVERQPLITPFGDAEVFTFGPPGAGRTLIEAINLLEHFPELPEIIDTPRGVLLLAHIIRKANIDRSDRPADPTLFAQELELDEDITHKDYAARAAKRIHRRIKSSGETTHLSTIDAHGNMVALTQSIERVYGSFSASPKLGFLYNNYMSAFEYRDITHPYYLRPNAVPWASVAPTILLKTGEPWLSIGSPGSERIVSAVLQVLLRLFRGDTPYTAVEAPRMHVSIKGKVSLEGTRMRSDIGPMLSRHGFDLQVRDPYSFFLGSIQLVMSEGGTYLGVADPRRDGSAQGPD